MIFLRKKFGKGEYIMAQGIFFISAVNFGVSLLRLLGGI